MWEQCWSICSQESLYCPHFYLLVALWSACYLIEGNSDTATVLINLFLGLIFVAHSFESNLIKIWIFGQHWTSQFFVWKFCHFLCQNLVCVLALVRWCGELADNCALCLHPPPHPSLTKSIDSNFLYKKKRDKLSRVSLTLLLFLLWMCPFVKQFDVTDVGEAIARPPEIVCYASCGCGS